MHLRFRAVLVAALALLALIPATSAFAIGNILPSQAGLPDIDARAGSVVPTAAQQQLVASLGGHATWNRFGTPQSLINYGGYLATGLGSDPVAAAKSFITTNEALFRLTDQGVANLELLNDSPMVGSEGHAVLFRQTFGGLPATQDGLITVGVVGGKVAYVSSSSAGDGNAPAAATLVPQAAWLIAAANVGYNLSIVDLSAGKNDNGWRAFHANGLSDVQRARLTALPTPTGGVRPAYETIVLDARNSGGAHAYTVFVDAVTGKILLRHNDVQNLNETQTCDSTGRLCEFDGEMPGSNVGQCGVNGPFAALPNTKSVDVADTADVVLNDILTVLVLNAPNGTVVGSSDEATSPEAIHYEPSGGISGGTTFFVKTCPSPNPLGPFVSPLTYHGSLVFNDAAGTPQPPLQNTPKWRAFKANPTLGTLSQYPWNYASTDTRINWCWLDSLNNLSSADSNCNFAVKNLASRVPWDAEPHTGVTTGTTTGNNATTGEAWLSPLTAGGAHQQPMHPTDRAYIDPWTNQWFNSKCDPTTSFTVAGNNNDILPAVTNLFVGHNRMHDFSYYLGFTETNFNAQLYNFGNTAPGPYPLGREGDPEEGDVQAGAVSGGAPTYEGRDNANQIALNDGIPPITNQYLFQPIAGAFYAPCVDGDMDTSVFGHEYTHLISNRMVAGPDSGLSGNQAGAMGESWSDLDAEEYLHENGFVPTNGENPWAVGAYATGNKNVGIRDYALDANPLNYSDVGFDTPGAEVHADGEIWNGTNYDVRQALVNKYDATYPSSDAALQKRCADGILPADQCPGNRRWIQLVYDGWLLDQSGPSMLDARDSYLAADLMRFGGANQTAIWHAFAARGMGNTASSTSTDDNDPIPGFSSPNETNATVTFNATAPDEGNATVKAKVYVGKYEAGVTPVADTDPGTALPATAKFVAGTYDFVAQAPGYGLFRFTQTFTAGQTTTVKVPMPTNWASSNKGATASGDGTNPGNLIDDTENTPWESDTAPVAGKQVTVKLGGAHTITRVQVSAALNAGQDRFSALRSFEIWACTATVANGNCTTGFTKVFTSAADAFPGVAPRPVAPNLIIRSFTLPSAVSATHLKLVVNASQCTGAPAYAGEQDNDPTNSTDCTLNSGDAGQVIAAELEAFSNSTGTQQPPPPPPTMTSCGYPYSSSNPRTSVVFNEPEILRASGVFGSSSTGHVALFYNDEHAMVLGVNPGVTAMTANPDHATNPSVGNTTATDPSGRPEFPAAFVTNVTADPSSTSGDWQQQSNNGTAISPSDVFGTWKAATSSGSTITPGADPAKNNWNLGAGADPVPTTNGQLPKNEGYGAEASWSFAKLGFTSGNTYRVQFMVHDGDQNKTGGDVGQGCVIVSVP